MTAKPITLYSHTSGPNPYKVQIILEELHILYKIRLYEDLGDLKKPAYEAINPNGRVPAIEDPNTDTTLWESGAIIEYLVTTYDTKHTISFEHKTKEYFLAEQFLHFQMSGQGPYFGQAAWFSVFHPEKVPSALSRYRGEAIRITKVLNSCLKGKQYLVGDKCTYADLSFVTWYSMLPFLMGEDMGKTDWEKELPDYSRWMSNLMERPAVKKVMEEKAKNMGKH